METLLWKKKSCKCFEFTYFHLEFWSLKNHLYVYILLNLVRQLYCRYSFQRTLSCIDLRTKHENIVVKTIKTCSNVGALTFARSACVMFVVVHIIRRATQQTGSIEYLVRVFMPPVVCVCIERFRNFYAFLAS